MKFLPGLNLFDDAFDDMFFDPIFTKKSSNIMKTDVTEKDGNYLLDMELPGYGKEDIKIELKDGYLNVSASKNTSNEEKDDKGNVIRQERYTGSCSRSFYVGDGVKETDIKAKFESGILHIELPANKPAKQLENKGYIAIEG